MVSKAFPFPLRKSHGSKRDARQEYWARVGLVWVWAGIWKDSNGLDRQGLSRVGLEDGQCLVTMAEVVKRPCRLTVFDVFSSGINIINVGKTWEKIVLAARVLATIENPADVCVISARPYGHRAVLKFASATGAQAIAGRFTPGNL